MKEVIEGLPRIFPGICVTTEDWHVMIGSHEDGMHSMLPPLPPSSAHT